MPFAVVVVLAKSLGTFYRMQGGILMQSVKQLLDHLPSIRISQGGKLASVTVLAAPIEWSFIGG